MTNDPLDRIRAACREVSERAAFVHIDRERLSSYAREYAVAPPEQPTDGGPARLGDDEETAAVTIQLDAINFGSGWHPVLTKRPGLSGARTVAAAFWEYAQRHGPLTAGALLGLSTAHVGELVGQDPEGPAAELVAHFTDTLSSLGQVVTERYGGQFAALVEGAGHSAGHLVGELADLPIYRDTWAYGDLEVPLLKRAQITVNDLATTFDGSGLGRFVDLDRLTMFPDNLVPHVLRVDGVLRYEATLARRIDSGELLQPGEAAEVEIRACGVHAVELLSEAVRADGGTHAPRQIDEILWRRGGAPTYKAVPRHRCRTTAY